MPIYRTYLTFNSPRALPGKHFMQIHHVDSLFFELSQVNIIDQNWRNAWQPPTLGKVVILSYVDIQHVFASLLTFF